MKVVAEEPEGLQVVVGQLVAQAAEVLRRLLLHPLPVPGLHLPRLQRRAPPPLPDKVGVEAEGAERLRQLPHVELHNVGDHIGVDVGEVDQVGAVLEGLAELLHLGLDAGHPVKPLDVDAALVDFEDAAADQRRDLRPHLQQVVTQRHPEGRHLPRQPLLTAHQVNCLQALLVRRQPALGTFVTVKVHKRVTFSAPGGFVKLFKVVRIRCS